MESNLSAACGSLKAFCANSDSILEANAKGTCLVFESLEVSESRLSWGTGLSAVSGCGDLRTMTKVFLHGKACHDLPECKSRPLYMTQTR